MNNNEEVSLPIESRIQSDFSMGAIIPTKWIPTTHGSYQAGSYQADFYQASSDSTFSVGYKLSGPVLHGSSHFKEGRTVDSVWYTLMTERCAKLVAPTPFYGVFELRTAKAAVVIT